MKAEILKMLRKNDGYISGQQICEYFGVSRTAVWKAINQLKEEGYVVEAIRNKGYRILSSPDITTKEELESQINTSWAGRTIYYYAELDSTNLEAKRLGEKGAPHGTLAVADMQTAGRGRRGRGWSSPSGSSIYMTILLRPDLEPNRAPMMTLIMAYSVACAVQEQTGLEAKIKWPNDIVIHGHKICGILTEMSTEIDYIHYVIIGVGINVNIQEFPEEIRETATSISLELGQAVKRSSLLACVMSHFEKNYQVFMETQDLSKLREKYNQLLVNYGREVKVLGETVSYHAIALGINDKGELQVKKEDGTEASILSGEVSVRGIYGYV